MDREKLASILTGFRRVQIPKLGHGEITENLEPTIDAITLLHRESLIKELEKLLAAYDSGKWITALEDRIKELSGE